jgi:hypothetical protein
VIRGLTGGFMKDIDLPAAPDRWEPLIEGIGRVGYIAKGIAFGIVGVLLFQAATSHNPAKSRGLDAALRLLVSQPYGVFLLILVALGLAAFGVYCFFQARYRKVSP